MSEPTEFDPTNSGTVGLHCNTLLGISTVIHCLRNSHSARGSLYIPMGAKDLLHIEKKIGSTTIPNRINYLLDIGS